MSYTKMSKQELADLNQVNRRKAVLEVVLPRLVAEEKFHGREPLARHLIGILCDPFFDDSPFKQEEHLDALLVDTSVDAPRLWIRVTTIIMGRVSSSRSEKKTSAKTKPTNSKLEQRLKKAAKAGDPDRLWSILWEPSQTTGEARPIEVLARPLAKLLKKPLRDENDRLNGDVVDRIQDKLLSLAFDYSIKPRSADRSTNLSHECRKRYLRIKKSKNAKKQYELSQNEENGLVCFEYRNRMQSKTPRVAITSVKPTSELKVVGIAVQGQPDVYESFSSLTLDGELIEVKGKPRFLTAFHTEKSSSIMAQLHTIVKNELRDERRHRKRPSSLESMNDGNHSELVGTVNAGLGRESEDRIRWAVKLAGIIRVTLEKSLNEELNRAKEKLQRAEKKLSDSGNEKENLQLMELVLDVFKTPCKFVVDKGDQAWLTSENGGLNRFPPDAWGRLRKKLYRIAAHVNSKVIGALRQKGWEHDELESMQSTLLMEVFARVATLTEDEVKREEPPPRVAASIVWLLRQEDLWTTTTKDGRRHKDFDALCDNQRNKNKPRKSDTKSGSRGER